MEPESRDNGGKTVLGRYRDVRENEVCLIEVKYGKSSSYKGFTADKRQPLFPQL